MHCGKLSLAPLALLAACFTAGPVSAQVIASSTFNTGDEGWLVGDFYSNTGFSTPTYVATGGNPGGFLRTNDLYGYNSYQAPSAFLGNQSGAYGGTLSLDQRVLSSDGVPYAMLVISDGTQTLQYMTNPPGTSFTHFDIPLLASAGWQNANTSGNAGSPATELQLQQVLSGLTFLHLDADWQSGSDQVDLDNVILSGSGVVPEPGSVALLMGLSVSGAGFLSRRLKH